MNQKGLSKGSPFFVRYFMKKTILTLTTLLLFTCIFTSCASKQKVQKERSEHFIADIDPFYIGELHLYTRMTVGSPKISDFELTYYPRSNVVSLKVKIGLDVIKIGFSYADRKKFYEAANSYIDSYENNMIKEEKPSKKNSILKDELPLSWGVFGYSHDISVKYMVNYEYLEPDRPYFRLKFDATTDPEDGTTSPAFSIYISPAQWKQIFEICNQQALEAKCDEVLAQAEAW